MAAELLNYLQTTSERLNAEGFAPEPQLLKGTISPKVADSVRRLSANAPAEVRGKLKVALEESKVLSSEANLEELRAGVANCIQILGGQTNAEAGPANTDGGAEQEKPAEIEEEAADVEDDVFAMMGGMGEEEEYKVTFVQETAAEDLPDEKGVEAAKDAPADAEGDADKKAPGQGKNALADYLKSTLVKLNADGFAPEEGLLKGKIMPSVVNSVREMTGGAPAELRNKLKAAFESNKVIPGYEADLDGLRAAIEACLEVLQDGA